MEDEYSRIIDDFKLHNLSYLSADPVASHARYAIEVNNGSRSKQVAKSLL